MALGAAGRGVVVRVRLARGAGGKRLAASEQAMSQGEMSRTTSARTHRRSSGEGKRPIALDCSIRSPEDRPLAFDTLPARHYRCSPIQTKRSRLPQGSRDLFVLPSLVQAPSLLVHRLLQHLFPLLSGGAVPLDRAVLAGRGSTAARGDRKASPTFLSLPG